MFTLALNSLWARKRRLFGTCLAVVIGVAFLAGTTVLGDTLSANFTKLFSDVSAGTDVVVRNNTEVAPGQVIEGRGLIDASLLSTVQQAPGVAHAEGQVVGYGTLLGADGSPIGGDRAPPPAGRWNPPGPPKPHQNVPRPPPP